MAKTALEVDWFMKSNDLNDKEQSAWDRYNRHISRCMVCANSPAAQDHCPTGKKLCELWKNLNERLR